MLVQNYDLVSFCGLTASCISTSHVLFFKDKFKYSEHPVSQNSSMFRYLFNNNITSQAQTTSQQLMSQPLLEGSRTMPEKTVNHGRGPGVTLFFWLVARLASANPEAKPTTVPNRGWVCCCFPYVPCGAFLVLDTRLAFSFISLFFLFLFKLMSNTRLT